MTASPTSGDDPIKVGVIADQTGPLSPMGLGQANVARMVVGDINAKGGLLGRPLELHLEDSATRRRGRGRGREEARRAS
jgi:branched-chain amino acid transport system substrate-binding protein